MIFIITCLGLYLHFKTSRLLIKMATESPQTIQCSPVQLPLALVDDSYEDTATIIAETMSTLEGDLSAILSVIDTLNEEILRLAFRKLKDLVPIESLFSLLSSLKEPSHTSQCLVREYLGYDRDSPYFEWAFNWLLTALSCPLLADGILDLLFKASDLLSEDRLLQAIDTLNCIERIPSERLAVDALILKLADRQIDQGQKVTATSLLAFLIRSPRQRDLLINCNIAEDLRSLYLEAEFQHYNDRLRIESSPSISEGLNQLHKLMSHKFQLQSNICKLHTEELAHLRHEIHHSQQNLSNSRETDRFFPSALKFEVEMLDEKIRHLHNLIQSNHYELTTASQELSAGTSILRGEVKILELHCNETRQKLQEGAELTYSYVLTKTLSTVTENFNTKLLRLDMALDQLKSQASIGLASIQSMNSVADESRRLNEGLKSELSRSIKVGLDRVQKSVDCKYNRLLGLIPELSDTSQSKAETDKMHSMDWSVEPRNPCIYSYITGSNTLCRTYLKTREESLHKISGITFGWYCSLTELPNGQIFVTGGGVPAKRSVICIDPKRFEATQQPLMVVRRSCHATAVYKGWLYVFGGSNESKLRECERYSLKDKRWSSLKQLPHPCDCASAILLEDFKAMYVFGGLYRKGVLNIVQRLNLETLSWMLLPIKLPRPSWHIACFKVCDKIYFVLKDYLYSYSPSYESFRPVKKLPQKIQSCCGACIYTASILFCSSDEGVARKFNIGSLI